MKKLNKFFAVLVALAMMATLCVTMAFAEPAAKSTDISKSVLTKVFDVPDGVTAPEATFQFTFTADAGNPSGPAANAPVTESITLATGTGTQTKNLALDSFIGLNDTSKAINITQPGEYKFTVDEVDDTYTLKTGEKVTYDQNTYVLRLYVINDNGTLKFSAITVEDNSSEAATTDAKKVDPEDKTPEGKDPTKQDECVGSEFKFTNYYTKNIEDTEANGGAFNLEKDVTNSGNTTVKYPFTVTIAVDKQTVTDYATEGTYTITSTSGKTWTFTATKLEDTRTDIELAKGEKLIFTKFPAGAIVTVNEKLDDTVVQNGSKYTATAAGLATGDVKNKDASTAAINAKGQIKVTNDLANSEITPEGILISNLPYIALALVAIGGLVAYVVVRRRNADEA